MNTSNSQLTSNSQAAPDRALYLLGVGKMPPTTQQCHVLAPVNPPDGDQLHQEQEVFSSEDEDIDSQVYTQPRPQIAMAPSMSVI